MTLPNEFLNFYPNQIPIAWLLRESNKHIWFRIHSLPESKRYAKTDNEYTELLKRHNQFATDVIGEKSEFLLFWYGKNPSGGIHGQKVLDYSDDDVVIKVYYSSGIWEAHNYDTFLRCVADDICSSSVFQAVGTGDIYAPYDGGADVIIRESKKLHALKTKYKKWFSTHESGM